MPAPSTVLLFTVLMMIIALFTYVRARKKESSFKYLSALAYIYITEISFMFFLFLFLFSSPLSPFTYQENSNLKVFLDFFTVYQITIFIFTRTIKNLSDQPYKYYILVLKRIDIMLAKKQWKALHEYSVELKEKIPNNHFNKSVNSRRNNLHIDIDMILMYSDLEEIKGKMLKELSAEKLEKYKKAQLENNIDSRNFEKTVTEIREHIELEIAQTELILEEVEVRWSGSIALIFVPVLERKLVGNKIQVIQMGKNYFNVIDTFLKSYRFHIINLILLLTLTIILMLTN